MRSPVVNLVIALAIPALAAVGGALMVYSGYDDAPGGVLIGMVLVVCAFALGGRAGLRRG